MIVLLSGARPQHAPGTFNCPDTECARPIPNANGAAHEYKTSRLAHHLFAQFQEGARFHSVNEMRLSWILLGT
ncbi:hypothetical protein [Rhodopila sp.]|jgi:hypothetical protein|uniref:hypothetical protein n=1 Tax=Rhodopila sp. TaxID=2480087 RepID=UPI002D7EFD8A|nr:hypothetical protein [Rhodopila sp.]